MASSWDQVATDLIESIRGNDTDLISQLVQRSALIHQRRYASEPDMFDIVTQALQSNYSDDVRYYLDQFMEYNNNQQYPWNLLRNVLNNPGIYNVQSIFPRSPRGSEEFIPIPTNRQLMNQAIREMNPQQLLIAGGPRMIPHNFTDDLENGSIDILLALSSFMDRYNPRDASQIEEDIAGQVLTLRQVARRACIPCIPQLVRRRLVYKLTQAYPLINPALRSTADDLLTILVGDPVGGLASRLSNVKM